GMVIFVHELGHFIIARLCKVKVEKFSFGFGPKLVGIKIGETEYRVSLIPLGGYVKMLGENPDKEDDSDTFSNESFKYKKWWQKALIALGGPLSNFIFAIIILSLTFMIGIKTYDLEPIVGQISKINNQEFQKFKKDDKIIEIDGNKITGWMSIVTAWTKNDKQNHEVVIIRNGETTNLIVQNFDYQNWFTNIKPYVSAEVGEVLYGLPAYQSGIIENDIIIGINDTPINDWYDMQKIIKESPEIPLNFIIKRNDEIINMTVIPQLNLESDSNVGIIGISQKLNLLFVEKFSIFKSIKYGFMSSIATVYRYYNGLFRLFRHPQHISKSFGGPIMIAAITGQQAEQGLTSFLSFMAMISIILMIMNLLPIPVLDGGLIIFALLEGIFGKPVKPSIQALSQRIGLAIILTLMIFAFYNDISRFVSRQFSLKRNIIPGELKPQ
ncbi:MAG: RIP metalloprotease RseP, partial [Candidatus Cloacimonetes bacterium]|nr:RIP metalloprotease RseP [Candidatus Cloacimonadota bacterium]